MSDTIMSLDSKRIFISLSANEAQEVCAALASVLGCTIPILTGKELRIRLTELIDQVSGGY